ncbi:hypothetical protein ABZ412_35370 [Nocardia sp. NPDC005746]|uniref:alpha/beta fold hydrolase n=1 Tax=Nocardia sp. NPDC005746 TaxID=3157062 RepID=UPI0033F94AC2
MIGDFGSIRKFRQKPNTSKDFTHPGRPLQIFFLPPVLSLSAITAPAVLIHTNYWFQHRKSYYNKQGILMAAMDDKDVCNVLAHLPGADLIEVDSGHNVHFERPEVFLRAVRELAAKAE